MSEFKRGCGSLLLVASVVASPSCSSSSRVFTDPVAGSAGAAGVSSSGASNSTAGGMGAAGDSDGPGGGTGGSAGGDGEGGAPDATPATCNDDPCQNGAACVDAASGATCSCLPGYEGPVCAVNVDDCQDGPCQNAGTCTDGVDSFTCSCPEGFAGALCERVATSCTDDPCQNGAACTNTAESYTCACLLGFKGRNCEVNEDNCSPAPCQNGAACVDGINDFTCQCKTGYSGKTCATNIDDCKANVCKNGGTCVDGVAAYSCQCTNRYTGPACEFLEVKVVPADFYLGAESRVTALSNNGSVALLNFPDGNYVGRLVDFDTVTDVDLSSLKPNGRWGYGLSEDGAVIAGQVMAGASYVPFALVGTSARLLDLSPLPDPGTGSKAMDVSADGSTIVGAVNDSVTNKPEAFRYTATGSSYIGDWLANDGFHEANAVSGDGSVVAGTAGGPNGLPARVWLWKKSTGTSVTLALGGATWSNPSVSDISRDGKAVVGVATINGVTHLVRWRANNWTPEDLGTGVAFGTNRDGTVVVGADNSGNAIVWTSAGGKVTLASILGSNPDLAGVKLAVANGVSDDGKVVAGTAEVAGKGRGFMARLP